MDSLHGAPSTVPEMKQAPTFYLLLVEPGPCFLPCNTLPTSRGSLPVLLCDLILLILCSFLSFPHPSLFPF
jgi:hypothetical protein